MIINDSVCGRGAIMHGLTSMHDSTFRTWGGTICLSAWKFVYRLNYFDKSLYSANPWYRYGSSFSSYICKSRIIISNGTTVGARPSSHILISGRIWPKIYRSFYYIKKLKIGIFLCFNIAQTTFFMSIWHYSKDKYRTQSELTWVWKCFYASITPFFICGKRRCYPAKIVWWKNIYPKIFC